MQHHRTTLLGDLGEINVGFQLRERTGGPPDPHGEYHLLQLRNVQEGVLDLSDLSQMTFDTKAGRPLARHLVRPGDILLRSRGATYGAAPVVEVPENTVALAPLFLLRLSPDVPVLPDYLVWFINRAATQAALKTVEGGTYTPSVSLSHFKELPITLPPLKTQQQIIEINELARHERELARQQQNARDRQIAAFLEQVLKG